MFSVWWHNIPRHVFFFLWRRKMMCFQFDGIIYQNVFSVWILLGRKLHFSSPKAMASHAVKNPRIDLSGIAWALVDMGLLRRTSSCTEEYKNLNCLSSLINVGLLCTNESPQGQPTMMVILGILQNIKDGFLGATSIPKFQSNITHLLGSTSTTLNNIYEGQSSSTS